MSYIRKLSPLQAFEGIKTIPLKRRYARAVSLLCGLKDSRLTCPVTRALSNVTRGPKTDPDKSLARARADYFSTEEELGLRKNLDPKRLDIARGRLLRVIAGNPLMGGNDPEDLTECYFPENVVALARRVLPRAYSYVRAELVRAHNVEKAARADRAMRAITEYQAGRSDLDKPVVSLVVANAVVAETDPVVEADPLAAHAIVASAAAVAADADLDPGSNVIKLFPGEPDEIVIPPKTIELTKPFTNEGLFSQLLNLPVTATTALFTYLEGLQARYPEERLDQLYASGLDETSAQDIALLDTYKRVRVLLRDFVDAQDISDLFDIALEDIPEIRRLGRSLLARVRRRFFDDQPSAVRIELRTVNQSQFSMLNHLWFFYQGLVGRNPDWRLSDLEIHRDGQGLPNVISFQVSGIGAQDFFDGEAGQHNIKLKSEQYGSLSDKIVDRSILVHVLRVEADIAAINEKDITTEFISASTNGGQHANATKNGVRMVHKPTGIMVRNIETRYREQNRQKALKVLASRVAEYYEEQRKAAERARRKRQSMEERVVRDWNLVRGVVVDYRFGIRGRVDAIRDWNPEELLAAHLGESFVEAVGRAAG